MFEIEWKAKKSVYRNLLQVKGISRALALKVCALLGISTNTQYMKLSPHKVDQLNLLLSIYRKKTTPFLVRGVASMNQEVLQCNYGDWGIPQGSLESNLVLSNELLHTPILSNLEEYRKENIKMLINLNTYRGRRFKQGYPVKGQRTRSNAKTARKLNRIQL